MTAENIPVGEDTDEEIIDTLIVSAKAKRLSEVIDKLGGLNLTIQADSNIVVAHGVTQVIADRVLNRSDNEYRSTDRIDPGEFL